MASGGEGGSLILSGPISGAGALEKAGGGTLTLSGTNSFTGATTVTSGGLNLAGTTLSAVTVMGGTLSGSGVISNNVTINSGTNAPGMPSIYGNYQLASTGTLELKINGTTPGAEYDRLVVLGGDANAVTLAGQLKIVARAALPTNTTFMVIQKDGTNPSAAASPARLRTPRFSKLAIPGASVTPATPATMLR